MATGTTRLEFRLPPGSKELIEEAARLLGISVSARRCSSMHAQAASLSDTVGIAAVEVHAIDDEARDFYLRFGFTLLTDDRHHLYLPIRVIRKAAAQAGDC